MASSSPSLGLQVLRRLWRDARAGELRLLMLGLMLAVAAVSAVALLGDRIEKGLKRDAAALIGGDLVVSADRPADARWRERAQGLGLRQSHSASFPSMVRASDAQGGATRLVAVKAVDDAYPLRGQLQWLDERGEGQGARGPAQGQVWVDAAVLDSLGLNLGDRLGVGELWLRIGAQIRQEPDRGAGFLAFAPRVMLHGGDLAATQLVQPASRIGYRMALSGEASQVAALRELTAELEAALRDGQWRGARIETLASGRPELRQTLDRGERFLSLVALLAALLSGIAVALTARDFAARHLDECALLRVLGQRAAQVGWTYAAEFLLAGLAGSLAGLALGYLLHMVLLALLGGLVGVALPAAGVLPYLLGLGLGLALLVAFGLPPVLALARVPPLRVLHRDAGTAGTWSAWFALLTGGAGSVALLMAVARDATLGLLTLAGFALAGALLVALAWGVIRFALPRIGGPQSWRLATRQLGSRPALAAAQVAALGLGLLALALLALVRTDLMESWRMATPDRGPDRFVINLLPDQGEAFRTELQQAGVQPIDWYPMFRGRLTTINGEAVTTLRFATDRASRLVEREFNLSHAQEQPAHNRATDGRWLADSGSLSVEAGLAEQLGLKLGDRLGFDVAGQQITAPIGQIREVDWSSMRVNFFVMFQRAQMPEVPSTWIATFRAPLRDAAQLDRRLARAFPNATLIDVSEQIAQVQRVLGQIAQAVEILFGFTLAAGLVVLIGAMTATREVRIREAAVWRAMGASSALLARVQRAELLTIGLLAGAFAGLVALGLGALLAYQVFQFDWQPKPWVPLGTLAAGALLAWVAGYWGLRGVLRRPVLQTLRAATQD